MKEKTLLQKYNYYDDVLKKIGSYPLSENVTIDKLKLTRGVIQAAYKEMYGLRFSGSIIDYLCWVSAQYIIDRAGNISLAGYIRNNYDSIKEDANNLLRLASKKPELFDDSRELVLMWHDNYMSEIKSVT